VWRLSVPKAFLKKLKQPPAVWRDHLNYAEVKLGGARKTPFVVQIDFKRTHVVVQYLFFNRWKQYSKRNVFLQRKIFLTAVFSIPHIVHTRGCVPHTRMMSRPFKLGVPKKII